MKRKEVQREEKKLIEIKCDYCANKTEIVADENGLPYKGSALEKGWKSITKESDDCVETVYLCPDCFSRYKSGENNKSV